MKEPPLLLYILCVSTNLMVSLMLKMVVGAPFSQARVIAETPTDITRRVRRLRLSWSCGVSAAVTQPLSCTSGLGGIY